jgi:voltage-gated potassium channel
MLPTRISFSANSRFVKLKRTVETSDTTLGRSLDLFIQALIVLSMVTFAIETLPDLSPGTLKMLKVVEIFTVSVFTVEYLLRLFVAGKKLKFIFSFYGIIDLLAILPFFITPAFDLRTLRAFRLLRLFRAFKLVRYNKAIDRFQKALSIVKEELILYLSFSILILYIAASGIYFFETKAQPEVFSSIFDSLWWAVATLTTVGYGDIYPVTVGGKIFTFFILMIGLGIVAVPTGLLSSALSKAREMEDDSDVDKNKNNSLS